MSMSELFHFMLIGFILYNVIKDWNKPQKPPKYRGHV